MAHRHSFNRTNYRPKGYEIDKEFENWDPMSEDYNDREFNSYRRGLGVKLESQLQSGSRRANSKDGFKLFVKSIPKDMNQEAVYNVFSRCGKVTNLFLGSTNGPLNWAHVSFSNEREAEKAIKGLHKTAPFFFHVQYCEDSESKQKRLSNKLSLSDDSSVGQPVRRLGMGRGVTREAADIRFHGVNPQRFYTDFGTPDDDLDDNFSYTPGFFDAYDGGPFENTNKIIEPLIRVNNVDGCRRVSLGRGFYTLGSREINFEVRSSKERDELLDKKVANYVMMKNHNYENDEDVCLPNDYIREKCSICSALTSNVCVGCEVKFYCSRDCQVADWQRHKPMCQKGEKFNAKDDQSSSNTETPRRPKTEVNGNGGDNSYESPSGINRKALHYQQQQKIDSQNKTTPKYHSGNERLNQSNDGGIRSGGSGVNRMTPKYHSGDNKNESGVINQERIRNTSIDKGIHGDGSGDRVQYSSPSSAAVEQNFYKRPDVKQESNKPLPNHEPRKPERLSGRSVADDIMNWSHSSNKNKPTSPSTNAPATLIPTPSHSEPAPQKSTTRKSFFTIGVCTKVVPLHLISPTECYVVKKEDQEKLDELNDHLNQLMSKDSPTLPNPELKKKCAAQFDDVWYRAKIIDVNPLKILFVDYGNDQICEPADLKILPEEFCPIFPFAGRIVLKEGKIAGDDWLLEGKDICPVSKADGKWIVELVELKGKNSQTSPEKPLVPKDEQLSQTGYLVVESTPVPQPDRVTPTEKPASEDYKPQELDPSTNLLENIERSFKSRNIIEDITVEHKLHLQVTNMINDRTITATAICRSVPYIHDILNLSSALEAAPFDPNYKPECGAMVGVNFRDEWTRAIVHSVTNNTYSLFLPDRGCVEKDVKEVKKLPGESSSYPHLGVTVKCHSDVTGKIAVDDVILFELKSRDNNRWVGKIKNMKEGVNGKLEIVSDLTTGHLESWEPEFTDHGSLTCMTIKPGSNVIITAGHDATAIYVKPVSTETIEFFESISQEVAAHCLSAPPMDRQPVLGELIAAKWSDDMNYYRAQVLKKLNEKEYKVIFVDFGNIASVQFEDLKLLSTALKSQPCCAVRVGLKGVPMKAFTVPALEYINELSNNEILMTITFDDLSAVTLVTTNKADVNVRMIELMTPTWVKLTNSGKDAAGGHVIRRSNLAAGQPLAVNETIKLRCLNVLPFTGKNIQLIMCDPKSTILQHILDVLPNEIKEYCKNLPSGDRYVPRVGELCIAKYSVDGEYYRAECVSTSEFSANVIFLDYGNFGEVPYQDIHKMPLDLITTPAMGIFCNLIDIPYSEKLYKQIEMNSTDKNYEVKILRKNTDDYDVNVPEVTAELMKSGEL